MQVLRGKIVLLVLFWGAPLFGAEDPKPLDFAHDVSPILKRYCVECHGGDSSKGGFSLNTRALVLEAGVVESGAARDSELIARLTSDDHDQQMPPKDRPRLTAREVDTLRRWIDEGLSWEPGFSFAARRYAPPLRPRRPALPPPTRAARTNPIDRVLDAELKAAGRPLPESISDEQFLRRLHLDVLGKLPTPAELDEFLSSSTPDKRRDWIRRILQKYGSSDAATYDFDYAEHWLTFWNDLLRNTYTGTGFITGGRKRITPWLYRSLLNNKPYDRFVHELIAPTAESDGFITGIKWRGTVNSSQTTEIQFAQNITQAFLGINMKCASCHDSFIDRWKLEETYALASIYSTAPLELHRCDKPLGKFAQPAWIFPELGQIDPEASQPERLQQLAGLMVHPENGRLTRTIANRIWHRLMGRGIVHPVDAMHTRPWNEDLLDFLASYLADHDYDLKQLIQLICESQAYQSQTETVDVSVSEGEYLYRGPRARRMTAEQFVDAVWTLTGAAPATFAAEVERFRAKTDAAPLPDVQLAQWIWRSGKHGVPAGEAATFVIDFELKERPVAAVAVMTCDNSFTAWLNDAKVSASKNWTQVQRVSLQRRLKQGANRLVIQGKNAGNAPNPAGLFVHLVCIFTDGTRQEIKSGPDWNWTAASPNRRGRLPAGADELAPVTVLKGLDVWNQAVRPITQSAVVGAASGATLPVRASLVKNNELLKALGRPNRDQIVTSRPATLSTLEAIDLANGQRLFDWIQSGAARAIAEHPSPDGLTRWLFRAALSREPTSEELAATRELLGNQPQPEAVQDLIWSVLMTPEFQFIR